MPLEESTPSSSMIDHDRPHMRRARCQKPSQATVPDLHAHHAASSLPHRHVNGRAMSLLDLFWGQGKEETSQCGLDSGCAAATGPDPILLKFDLNFGVSPRINN